MTKVIYYGTTNEDSPVSGKALTAGDFTGYSAREVYTERGNKERFIEKLTRKTDQEAEEAFLKLFITPN